jgi:hypothetical protein
MRSLGRSLAMWDMCLTGVPVGEEEEITGQRETRTKEHLKR